MEEVLPNLRRFTECSGQGCGVINASTLYKNYVPQIEYSYPPALPDAPTSPSAPPTPLAPPASPESPPASPSVPPPTPPSEPVSTISCGAGTSLNEDTSTCEIPCDAQRRRMSSAQDATREAVSSYLRNHPVLAARLGVADGSDVDDELLNHIKALTGVLFGPPALSKG